MISFINYAMLITVFPRKSAAALLKNPNFMMRRSLQTEKLNYTKYFRFLNKCSNDLRKCFKVQTCVFTV